ncbi:MAG: hypothetical protein WB816_05630, partial [Methylocystis sp.]
MSIFDSISHLFTETEQEVVAIIAKAKVGVALAAHEISIGLAWVANNTPQIAADLQTAETLIVATGVGANPSVAAAITAANVAVAGLNQYAASVKSG